jgi:hypothetical protein
LRPGQRHVNGNLSSRLSGVVGGTIPLTRGEPRGGLVRPRERTDQRNITGQRVELSEAAQPRRRTELDAIRLLVVLGLVFFHSALVFDARDDYYVKNPETTDVTTILAGFGVVWADAAASVATEVRRLRLRRVVLAILAAVLGSPPGPDGVPLRHPGGVLRDRPTCGSSYCCSRSRCSWRRWFASRPESMSGCWATGSARSCDDAAGHCCRASRSWS